MMKITAKEKKRLLQLTLLEMEARREGYRWIAGVDEAGRGPLAGPVVAAACVIPEGLFFPGVNDSKQLSPEQRTSLYEQIIHHPDVSHGIGIISHTEIDRVNIYQATILAMLAALTCLKQVPEMILVDGLRLPHPTLPCKKIIKGDTKSQSIAAASIIAKETRDRLMREYHLKWPEYGFEKHKGYGTLKHREAIHTHGPCPIHRLSFEPLKSLKIVPLDFSKNNR